jgi:hypothetical protein
MKNPSNLLLVPLLFLAVIVCVGPKSSDSATTQKSPGDLTLKQRSAIELLISANALRSGFFSKDLLSDKLSFKAGELVHLGIVMTNVADESVKVCAFSVPYYQNRPELLQDNHRVGYAKHVAEAVFESDIGYYEFTRTPDIVELKPNVPLRVPSIQLQEWYGPLIPGHYRLVLRRTFACCADVRFKSSNEIRFGVTP